MVKDTLENASHDMDSDKTSNGDIFKYQDMSVVLRGLQRPLYPCIM